ncbi:MAG TPA: VOC family protein [Streptosporangiaceae bacterium]|nr:VOC family protein [Streptosporangiaceae bacterium]
MRVSGLLNCGLQIPSLEAGRSFYTDFGLEVSEQGNALAVRCTGRDQDQVILTEGPRKRLDHVAFAVEPGSLPDWQRHLEGLGVRLLYIGDGLWFEDEEGNLVRLRDTGLAPWRPFPPEAFNVGDSVARTDAARWLVAAESPRPRRLGHMLIFVADIVAAEAFYTRALGLRLSDRVPGKATFLNSGPGDHHVFGFVQSTHPGLHHTSFEVANIDQLGMGAQLMAANGHREGWGLGRHSLGSNLFHYIRDPWGSWIEYFTDIDRITEDWIPREWQTPPAVWCPLMPEQFLINLEDRP